MTIENLVKALVKAQLEISPPVKDKKNPHFKSEYCSLDSIYGAVRIPLAKNGLTLSHSVEWREDKYFLKTTLYHLSGEEISNMTPMFVGKLDAQGYQSANTYARRSAVTSLLGLPTEEDDDGNEATGQQSKSAYLSFDQCTEIMKLIGNDDELLVRILAGYKVNKIQFIYSQEYPKIIRTLTDRKAK